MFFVCHCIFYVFLLPLIFFGANNKKIQFDGFCVCVCMFFCVAPTKKNIFHISHIFLSQRNINHIFISHIFRNKHTTNKNENLHLFKPSNIDNLYRKIKYWVVSFFFIFFLHLPFSSSSFMNVLSVFSFFLFMLYI